MRKGVVIAGAVIIIIGVAALGAGLYLLVDRAGVANLGVSAQKTTAVLAPGSTKSVGATQPGTITIVAYTDNASAPLQVSSVAATASTRTVTRGGVTDYVAIFTSLGASPVAGQVVILNNQTKTVSIQYASVQTGLGALAFGGLAVLGGGLLFVVGIIVLIVGVVLKRRNPPNAGSPGPAS
ncbi:MAG: hypothetical protein JRN11_06350 [Nitrososphaerota archaeon]|nr:hypothetical protein [Nitrososphaerota archaeon]MDG7026352.1 hypothetical protein [Nitrososphaerota archaeon]